MREREREREFEIFFFFKSQKKIGDRDGWDKEGNFLNLRWEKNRKINVVRESGNAINLSYYYNKKTT